MERWREKNQDKGVDRHKDRIDEGMEGGNREAADISIRRCVVEMYFLHFRCLFGRCSKNAIKLMENETKC